MVEAILPFSSCLEVSMAVPFGPVINMISHFLTWIVQGKLRNGQKVAIKVLSSESRQGTREFLNELSVISNINHHNLVKLHGCCVDGDQKMLVYNYLENNSLAQSLFGKEQKKKSVSSRFSNHGEFVIRFVLRTLNLWSIMIMSFRQFP